jgi:hypothetical protein
MFAAAPEPHIAPAFYNLKTGELGRGPRENVAVRFGRWKITIPADDTDRRVEVFSFELQNA